MRRFNIRTAKRNDGGGSNYDLFDYQYHEQSGVLIHNRLYDLVDAADVNLTDDIPIGGNVIPDNGSVSAEAVNTNYNYRYDPLGNLVHDEREEIETIEWTVAGKVERVLRTVGSDRKELTFGYGPSGHRVMKQAGELYGDPTGYREHYVHDAQGNIMAIYKHSLLQAAPPVYSFQLNSRPIYGSDRLGTDELPVELANHAPYDPSTAPDVSGARRYELKDHLGNVMAVVTDRLTPAYIDGDNTVDAYKADVVSMQDYEPFGALLPGRNYSSDSYAHGFNGMRKDDEINGATGTSYDFGARLYDPRVGRWLSLDPLAAKYVDQSPYGFVRNSPLLFVDPNGRENVIYLVYLPSADNKITVQQAQAIAEQATRNFASMGLCTQVALVDMSKGKNAGFDPNKLDYTDATAVLGTHSDVIDFIANYDRQESIDLDLEWKGGGYHPEQSQRSNKLRKDGTGRFISIDANAIEGWGRYTFKTSDIAEIGALIVCHGAGHNAGAGHYADGTLTQSGSVIMNDSEDLFNKLRDPDIYFKCIEDITNNQSIPGGSHSRNHDYVKDIRKRFGDETPCVDYVPDK